MTRPSPLHLVALGIAVLAGLVFAISLLRGPGAPQGGPQWTGAPIRARATLSPREVYFGDSVRARVEVEVDRERVDPDSVTLKNTFAPYRSVGPLRRSRKDAGRLSLVSFETTLRCLELNCLPERARAALSPQPASVVFSDAGGEAVLRVDWPSLEVSPRITPSTESAFDSETLASWRAEYVDPPPVSYRLSPAWLEALLGVMGVLLIVVGAGFLLRDLLGTPKIVVQWRTARLPPLEHALRVLESPSLAEDIPARRRALDVLAVELGRTGEPAMAVEARSLAWTDAAPLRRDTRRLVTEVRTMLRVRENGNE
jgi:hypothetical protein